MRQFNFILGLAAQGWGRATLMLLACALLSLAGVGAARAAEASGRSETDLSGPGWQLWLDEQASYENDELFAPPVDLSKLPANPPTGGWGVLESGRGTAVSVPGTVEEYLHRGDGPKGDIKGVSWWTRDLTVPAFTPPKRVFLQFDSTRLRAEVYLDQKLVGYDLVANTPFECDITKFVRPGQQCHLAVRITDIGGNFGWNDFNVDFWGKTQVPSSHGFGGVTGPVRLVVVDPVYVSDVFVMNKTTLRDADVQMSVRNTSDRAAETTVSLMIVPTAAAGGAPLFAASRQLTVAPGETTLTLAAHCPAARLWDLAAPNLYTAHVRLDAGAAGRDARERTFGFRWFTVDGVGSDAVFRLNGRRVYLLSAISWGYWPVNGIYPTPEMAARQVRVAKQLGLNMLNFHRTIGSPIVLDEADKQGLLYYEEPGGYYSQQDPQVKKITSPFARALAREKLLRMVRRDRSHPSLVMYNMINEVKEDPDAQHKRDIADAHALDPTRLITYSSGWYDDFVEQGKKMHMRPGDMKHHYVGWFDFHRASGPVAYADAFYQGPRQMERMTTNSREIVFWGENGAVSTPPRLELIRKELKAGGRLGWDGDTYLKWHEQTRQFLERKKLKDVFPTVDAFTLALGKPCYDYQGRIIENTRIGNLTDGYVINGWEATISENHSGIVDVFRHPKADPKLLAHYTQPLYVAVKAHSMVFEAPGQTTLDFFVVNEKDRRGEHTLKVKVEDRDNNKVFGAQWPVTLAGGETFGQLLKEGVPVAAKKPGLYHVEATLLDKAGKKVAEGREEFWAVAWRGARIKGTGAVYETTDTIKHFLKAQFGREVTAYSGREGKLDWLILAGPLTDKKGRAIAGAPDVSRILERARKDGTTVLVIDYADHWSDAMAKAGALKVHGRFEVGKNWVGGQYFVREHPLFKNLPTDQAMSWPYQEVIRMGRNRYGLMLEGEDLVAGCLRTNLLERGGYQLGTAVGVIKMERGRVVLSALQIVDNLDNPRPASVVGRKLLCNYLEYAMK